MTAEPVEVTEHAAPAWPGAAPEPRAFRWRGQDYRVVTLIKRWQDDPARARGMRGPGALPFASGAAAQPGRTYFRVRTGDGAVFDLAHDPGRPRPWVLLRRLSPGSPGEGGS